MKKILILLLGFCLIKSFQAQSQERTDEVRKQLSIAIDGQSEQIKKIPGWSRIENQQGKFWKQSDTTAIQSYLPCCHEETGFEYLQLYKFTVEGEACYLLLLKYNDDKMRLFAFRASGLSELKGIVEKADGQSHNAVEIMFCQYIADKEVQSFDPEEAIKNKEMIRWLLLGKGDYYSNDCKGARLFNIQTQLLKGETIVRFNILPWRGSQGNLPPVVTDNYFELKKKDFEKLYQFVPYENEIKYQKEGGKKLASKDYKGAIMEYSEAIKLNPKNPSSYNARGIAKFNLEDYTGALVDFSKAVELCPKEKDYNFPIKPETIAVYYENRGNTKMELKDYSGAVSDYLKSYEFYMNQGALYGLGKAKYNLGDYEGATKEFNRAINLGGNNEIKKDVYLWNAWAFYHLKRFNEAIDEISKAIDLNPKWASLYYRRALIYNELMDWDNAMADANNAIELDSKFDGAYGVRALTRNNLKDYSGAIADCDKALEINPEYGDAYSYRGLAKIKIGEKESGCNDLSKAVELGYEKAKELISQYCK